MVTERIHATSGGKRCDHRDVRWDVNVLGLMFINPDGRACCSSNEGDYPTAASADEAIRWYRSGEPAKALQPIPTVHVGGTSATILLEEATEAVTALHEAMAKLVAAQPNQRDYEPQGEGAYERAARAHRSRLMRVGAVLAEMQQIAEGIDQGGDVSHRWRESA